MNIKKYLFFLFSIFFISKAFAQTSGNQVFIDSMSDDAIRAMTKRVYHGMANVAKASLTVENGALSNKVQGAFDKSMVSCENKSNQINAVEYRDALKNSMTGKPNNEILTPTLYASMQDCLRHAETEVRKVDNRIRFPAYKNGEFYKILDDERVIAELNKIDPGNLLLRVHQIRARSTNTGMQVKRSRFLEEQERRRLQKNNNSNTANTNSSTPASGPQVNKQAITNEYSSQTSKKVYFAGIILAVLLLILLYLLKKKS